MSWCGFVGGVGDSIYDGPLSSKGEVNACQCVVCLCVYGCCQEVNDVLGCFVEVGAIRSARSSRRGFPVHPLRTEVPIGRVILRAVVCHVNVCFQYDAIRECVGIVRFHVNDGPWDVLVVLRRTRGGVSVPRVVVRS